MDFAALALARGWAFDTDGKMSTANARKLLTAPYPGTLAASASPKRALIRYVSLAAPSPADITVVERDEIFAAGWSALGLVQHVERPSWQANSIVGTQHGQAAVAHAQLVGYPRGCHLMLDVEGLGDAGAPVYDYCAYWCDPVIAAGYLPMPYDGYDDGMPDQWKELLVTRGLVRPTDWWSDYGPRQLPPGLSWAMKQHAQTTVGGELVDPDEILVDNVVVFMAPQLAAA